MTERSSIFDTGLDVTDFAPKSKAGVRPQPQDIDAAAGKRFKSREPADQSPTHNQKSTVDQPSTPRAPMTYRTGRNVVLSVKTSQATVDAFYNQAKKHGWKVAETFEKAIAALIASEKR